MKKFVVALLVLVTVFSFVACEEKTPEPTAPAGYKTITSGTTVAQLKEYIADSNVKGIWAAEKVTINMAATDVLAINRDFGIENVAFVGTLTGENGNGINGHPVPDGTGSTHAINISGTCSVAFKNVDFKNFSHAITVADDSSVSLTINGGKFENCFKGVYAAGLNDLIVSGVTMTGMGAESVPSGADASEIDAMKRSGAAFDIDQRMPGGSISITGSIFTDCGTITAGTDAVTDGKTATSGAIKIKVRYDEGDDVKFDSVKIIGNTFSGNRADIVLGTTNVNEGGDAKKTYPSELAANTTISNNIADSGLKLEDKSGNGYSFENGAFHNTPTNNDNLEA